MPAKGWRVTIYPNGRECTKCREFKSWDLFSNVKSGTNGKHSSCKACVASALDRKMDSIYRLEHRANNRSRHLGRRLGMYGVTIVELDRMMEKGCHICGYLFVDYGDATMDHCHESGLFRGLLCRNCNSAIGMLQDDPQLLRKAAGYIEEFWCKTLQVG